MLVIKGFYQIVIWYKPKTRVYYHRLIRGFRGRYEVGYINSYGHEVVDVIDIEFYIEKPRKLYQKKLLNNLRCLIDKLDKKL